jgi:flagellar biosynthesis protein FlhB
LIHGVPILTKIGVFGYFQLFRGTFGMATAIMFAFMLYERFLATIMYKTYETWWNIFVVIIPIIITISLAFLLCFLIISGRDGKHWQRSRKGAHG